jgi:hypothetical protein
MATLSLVSKTDTAVTLQVTNLPSEVSNVTFRQGGFDLFGIYLGGTSVTAPVVNGNATGTLSGFTKAGNYTFSASYDTPQTVQQRVPEYNSHIHTDIYVNKTVTQLMPVSTNTITVFLNGTSTAVTPPSNPAFVSVGTLSVVSQTDTSVTVQISNLPSNIRSPITFTASNGLTAAGDNINGTATATIEPFNEAGTYKIWATYMNPNSHFVNGKRVLTYNTNNTNSVTVTMTGQDTVSKIVQQLTNPEITVSGQVTTETGTGISNAVVKLLGNGNNGNMGVFLSAQTDPYGNYSFTVSQNINSFSLTCSVSGYIEYISPSIQVGTNESHFTQNIVLKPISIPSPDVDVIQPSLGYQNRPEPAPYPAPDISYRVGAWGWKINGTVMNSLTHLPLADVSVSSAPYDQHTMTDENGNYALAGGDSPMPSTATFALQGYTTQTISFKDLTSSSSGYDNGIHTTYYTYNVSLAPVSQNIQTNTQNTVTIQPATIHYQTQKETSNNTSTTSSNTSTTPSNTSTTSNNTATIPSNTSTTPSNTSTTSNNTSTTPSNTSTTYGMSDTGTGGGVSLPANNSSSSYATTTTPSTSANSENTIWWIVGGLAAVGGILTLVFLNQQK